jgi:hypothetical protein
MATTRILWHGVEAHVLENESVRAVVVPSMGAKIVSIWDKRCGCEWLAGPGIRPFRPAVYGAAFDQQDMSGWDEMLPTISACTLTRHGEAVTLPDHGEVWAVPWTVEKSCPTELETSVTGRALPYRFWRRITLLHPGRLRLLYHLVNLGDQPLPYLWAAHPQFACGEAAEIVLPAHVTEMYNVLPETWGWGTPETVYAWPQGVKLRSPAAGRETAPPAAAVPLDQIGPPTLRRARKLYAPPAQPPAWAALVRRPHGEWLRMAWNPVDVPYFGLWIDEGALNAQSVAAPEPATGFYDSLALACEKLQVTVVAPRSDSFWSITVQLGLPGESYEQP